MLSKIFILDVDSEEIVIADTNDNSFDFNTCLKELVDKLNCFSIVFIIRGINLKYSARHLFMNDVSIVMDTFRLTNQPFGKAIFAKFVERLKLMTSMTSWRHQIFTAFSIVSVKASKVKIKTAAFAHDLLIKTLA